MARAADLTTGAAYRVWDNQEAFHRDLTVAAIRHRDTDSIRATVQRINQAVAANAPLSEVLRIGAVANMYPNGPTDPFLIALSLRTLSGAVPALTEASQQRHAESMASFEALYQAILDRYSLRMRAPFGIEALSHSLAALAEGFTIQSMNGSGTSRTSSRTSPPVWAGSGRCWRSPWRRSWTVSPSRSQPEGQRLSGRAHPRTGGKDAGRPPRRAAVRSADQA